MSGEWVLYLELSGVQMIVLRKGTINASDAYINTGAGLLVFRPGGGRKVPLGSSLCGLAWADGRREHVIRALYGPCSEVSQCQIGRRDQILVGAPFKGMPIL